MYGRLLIPLVIFNNGLNILNFNAILHVSKCQFIDTEENQNNGCTYKWTQSTFGTLNYYSDKL